MSFEIINSMNSAIFFSRKLIIKQYIFFVIINFKTLTVVLIGFSNIKIIKKMFINIKKNFFLFEFLIEILLKEIQLKISTMKILKKESK